MIVICGLVLALAGCGGPTIVVVPVESGSAQLAQGEVLHVDLGEVNHSIGDQWYLLTPPDAAVLSEGEREYEADCDDPGCGGREGWVFTARGAGTTTLVFRYCYRSEPPSCEPQADRGPSDPVELTVTVGAP